jgi:hypothetical protein
MDRKPRKEHGFVRIELTQPQREELKHSTGRDAEALELNLEELEERIAPRAMLIQPPDE